MIEPAVLVLNQNYEPIHVCSARRALVLVFRGKAEVLEENHHVMRSTSRAYRVPSVIRLVYLVRRPRPTLRLTRKEIFLRDNYTCQYCGTRTRDLTLDHIVPRSRGGAHTWENLVSACRACNHKKGGKTLQEAHMRLLNQPAAPRVHSYYVILRRAQGRPNPEWVRYVPGLEVSSREFLADA